MPLATLKSGQPPVVAPNWAAGAFEGAHPGGGDTTAATTAAAGAAATVSNPRLGAAQPLQRDHAEEVVYNGDGGGDYGVVANDVAELQRQLEEEADGRKEHEAGAVKFGTWTLVAEEVTQVAQQVKWLC
jgi:hypothetical protein